MNMQYISVYKVHEYVSGSPPSVASFKDRIIAQKVIYLADVLGAYCGDYKWNWYKKGPYSPALSRVLYQNNENVSFENYYLQDETKELLEPLKYIYQDKPEELTQADWLELVASVHFLYKQSITKKIKEVIKDLLYYKPKYNVEQVKIAYKTLEEYGII